MRVEDSSVAMNGGEGGKRYVTYKTFFSYKKF